MAGLGGCSCSIGTLTAGYGTASGMFPQLFLTAVPLACTTNIVAAISCSVPVDSVETQGFAPGTVVFQERGTGLGLPRRHARLPREGKAHPAAGAVIRSQDASAGRRPARGDHSSLLQPVQFSIRFEAGAVTAKLGSREAAAKAFMSGRRSRFHIPA